MYIRNNIFSTDGTAHREKLAQLKKDYWQEESRWPKSFSQSPHSQGHSHHPRLTELQDLHLDLQLQSKPHPHKLRSTRLQFLGLGTQPRTPQTPRMGGRAPCHRSSKRQV